MIDWRHWHNEPYLVGGLIFVGWLYAVLTGPLRPWLAPGQAYPHRAARRFYAALLVFYLAVGSPLDQIGERLLFSAHMLQHQLLVYPAAMLFLSGLPDWLVRPVTARPALRGLLRFLAHPLLCGLGYSLIVSVWHAPALYEWALQNKAVHVLEHLMFFGAALWLWWPILSPARELPPISYAGQMIYLVGVTIAMTPVFAYITFAHEILYPTYEYAPRIFAGLSPGNDQLLAGSMMKLGGLAVSFAAFARAFYLWYQATERAPEPPAASAITASSAVRAPGGA